MTANLVTKVRTVIRALAISSGVLLMGTMSIAVEPIDRAHIRLEAKSKDRGIKGITFKSLETKVTFQELADGQIKAFTTLEFLFSRVGWEILLADGTRIHQAAQPAMGSVDSREKSYLLPILFNNTTEKIELMAVSSQGTIEKQFVYVEFQNLSKLIKQRKDNLNSKNTENSQKFQVSVDETGYSYTESRIPEFTEEAIQLEIRFDYAFPESKWYLGVSNSITVLPFAMSDPTMSTRILDLNVLGGYQLNEFLIAKDRVKAFLWGGLYFTTMFTVRDAFGYKNLMGPLFYPEIRYTIDAQNELGASFRLAFVGNNFGLERLTNRKLTILLDLKHLFQGLGPVSFFIELSTLRFKIGESDLALISRSVGIKYFFQ